MRRARRIAIATALAAFAAAIASDVRAQPTTPLRGLADRVIEEWGKAGGAVERGAPRFLYEDETMTVVLGPQAAGAERTCTTIALLGSRGASFHAKIAGTDDDPLSEDTTSRAASVAGILEMERCGSSALPMERLLVTSDAGRGAMETVVARSNRPLPPLREVLPERTGGVLPPSPDAGSPPSMPAPPKRAEAAETRAKRDGGAIEARTTWSAGADGSGEGRASLEPGCHRIEVFAVDARGGHTSRRRRLDVDAEVRDDEENLLGRDRSDAADARVELCVGKPVPATVLFAGAPAGTEVVATHAFWAMPDHLPTLWDTDARARMAHALFARHGDAPREDPIALFAGPPGATPVPIAIEPGACYLALAAVTHGHARGLGMRAVIGAREARDERTADDDAGAVAFCAGGADHARIEIEARGPSLAWGLAVYRMGGGMWSGR